MGISVRSGLDEHSLATLGIRVPIGRLTFYREHYLKKTLCIAAIGFALIAGRVALGDDTQPIEVDQETANALLLIGATEFIWADDSAIYYSLLGEEKCDCKPGAASLERNSGFANQKIEVGLEHHNAVRRQERQRPIVL